MDNTEKMAGYTRRRGNQRWTIQIKWQGTQDEGAIKDGQSRENGRVHKTKGQSKMDNPEKMAGYTRRRSNQRQTIQGKWQHRVHKTKEQSMMDNPEKMTAQGTQDEGAIKDGQSRENGSIGYKMKKIKTNTQHNMCWTPLCTNKHK